MFAERIAGGLITLDKESIEKIMDLNQRLNQSSIIVARRRQIMAQLRKQSGNFLVAEPDWEHDKFPMAGTVWIDSKAKNQTPDLNISGLGGASDIETRRQQILKRIAELEGANQ